MIITQFSFETVEWLDSALIVLSILIRSFGSFLHWLITRSAD